MMNAASSSNPSFIVDVGEAYPYPSVFAPNFVTVKLTGRNKFNLWKTQMICLLKSHHMFGFVDGQFPCPDQVSGKYEVGDMEAWVASDSLVKGWILGSLSEEAARKVVNHLTHKQNNTYFTAQDFWDELQRSYGPSVPEQAAETKVTTRQAESVIQVNSVSEIFEKAFWKKMIYRDILNGRTNSVLYLLKETGCTPLEQITNNRDTVLHVAVGSATKYYELFKKLLDLTPENTLLDHKNHNGNTLLHVAAIVGSTKHMDMLVKRNPELLLVKDGAGQTPLALSISSMDTKVSRCLAQHMKEKGYGDHFPDKSREELVLLAISLKDFSLANMIINDYPDAIRDNSAAVLTALAQTFPPELKFWERRGELNEIKISLDTYLSRLLEFSDSTCWRWLLLIVCLLFIGLCVLPALFYHYLMVLVRLFVGDKFHIQEDAKVLLFRVCSSLFKDNSSDYHHYYTNSIFEATRRNASTFIRCIMKVFPDAICTTNEDGHNFIQYSVINRSEKIYNLLYEMSEHKNIYKTIKDYSGNNLLHLAARLAPTNKLNLISGAALQIQRELQWFKAVERFVCPLNRIQENSDDETPEMVFTKEHKNLVNEGEIWIKKTAESYTITAALIITIVFAAAITVPGGNNQESGIPIFTNNIAFKVFVISDAISLFTAVTSLLLFLSILTARFAEQDFLHKLPMKLIIGLTMLFLSTTAMIIAFGATLFLVFGQSNLLMLIPIGALTCLPITSFVTFQFPLIVDLISSTYCGGIFVRERYDYFY